MREYVELDEMVMKWIGTKEMVADGFTKVLPGAALANHRDKLQLGKFEPCGGCCDLCQCRCGYQCTGYGLMHGRLTVCLRMLSRGRNML